MIYEPSPKRPREVFQGAVMTALQLSGCRVQLDLTSGRPQEAHHLAGDRGCNDGLGVACGRKQGLRAQSRT